MCICNDQTTPTPWFCILMLPPFANVKPEYCANIYIFHKDTNMLISHVVVRRYLCISCMCAYVARFTLPYGNFVLTRMWKPCTKTCAFGKQHKLQGDWNKSAYGIGYAEYRKVRLVLCQSKRLHSTASYTEHTHTHTFNSKSNRRRQS
jgi:hypothetical protein